MKLANRRMRKKVRALKKQKTALLRELFSLQRFCNEVAARLRPLEEKEPG